MPTNLLIRRPAQGRHKRMEPVGITERPSYPLALAA
jgi:hypothetical protein